MNKIKTFESFEFGQVRTMLIDNEPWFVGMDIAQALGYKRPSDAIASHVYEEDKLKLLSPLTNLDNRTLI